MLSYDAIFYSGGMGDDLTENACGLSDGFMRFLLSVSSLPQSFISGGEKVQLSDPERAMIESGLARLSEMYSKGCEMPKSELALSRGLQLRYEFPATSSWQTVLFGSSPDTPHFLIAPNGAAFEARVSGLYSINAHLRLDGPTSPTSNQLSWSLLFNSATREAVTTEYHVATTSTTSVIYYNRHLEAGEWFEVQAATNSLGWDVSTQTFLQVVYHG